MMILHPAKPLFDWGSLEDSPSLQTIKDLLAALPDGVPDVNRETDGRFLTGEPRRRLFVLQVLRC